MEVSRPSRTWLLRLVCLAVGCLMAAGSGPILAFNAYAIPLKDAFDYTQSELELCASFVNLGSKLGFPAGVLQEYLGSRVLSGMASVMAAASWTLIYLTLKYQATLSSSAVLVSVYFFFVGFSSVAAFMSAVPINFNNFVSRQRGQLVTCLEGSYSAGPILIVIIFSYAFTASQGGDEDLEGFLLLQACSWTIIFALGTVFLNEHPPEPQAPSEDSNLVKDEVIIAGTDGNTNDNPTVCPKNINETIYREVAQSEVNSVWGLPLIKDLDFQLILWSFFIFVGLQVVYLNNLTSFMISYGYYDNVEVYTILAPVFTVVALFISGPLSDCIAPTTPRHLLLFISHVVITAGFILLLALGARQAVFFVAMVGIEAGAGVIFSVTPTIISETYGVHYFGRNWGGALIGSGLSATILALLFGYYYDEVLHEYYPTAKYCFGSECYSTSLIVFVALAIIGIGLDIILLKRHYKNYRYYEQMVQNHKNKPISVQGELQKL